MKHTNSNTFDVIIIGAGPAGSMAAIEVVKSGLSVAIIEKVSLPRRKVCAGGLVKRATQQIPSDINYPIDQQCHNIALRIDSANIHFSQQRENLVTMVCRSAFDMALAAHAKSLGVVVMDNTKVTRIHPEIHHVQVETAQTKLQAKYLIFAEGATARLSNQFWSDERVLLPSLEADVYVSDVQFQALKNNATFDFGCIQGGYGWIFPKGDHFSIGLAVMNKNANVQLQQAFDAYLHKLGIENPVSIKNRKGFVIPLTPRQEPLMKGRMMLVGDTAGLVDPITAEGLSHAIQSGRGAGSALVTAFENPEKVAHIYHTATIQPILDELRVARLIAKIIYHPNTTWRNLLFRYYSERLTKGMADLIEGKRTYASSLKKHKFLNAIIKKASA